MGPILLSILDQSYTTLAVVDTFSEFAWSVRFNEAGDFEFSLPSQSPYVPFLVTDNYVYIRESDRLMIIEKSSVVESVTETSMTRVSGSSLETLLKRRVVWEKTTVSGNLQQAIKRLVNAAFVSPSIPERRVANFTFKESTDENITKLTVKSTDYHGQNLYEVITGLCQENKIGFRILPDWSNGGLIFELYSGINRSYTQSEIPWVMFSPQMENLLEGRFVETREELKTAALVLTSDKNWSVEVISKDLSFTGLQRRELTVESGVQQEEISIEKFGTPEERLNLEKYGYYEWDVTPENQAAYEQAKIEGKSVNKSDYGTVTYIIEPEKDEDYQRDLIIAQEEIQAEYQSEVAKESQRVDEALTSAGNTELAKYNKIKYFDGDIANTNQFVYGEDFFIGDIVQVRDGAGHEGVCRVTEVLITQDDGGVTISPTFESM